jgi:glycosyltransferase involved in cell wall biosynthesis
MAAGCPVIVNRVGGASESVLDRLTGVHYDPDDESGFAAAVDAAERIDGDAARRRALEFDRDRFIEEVREWVLGGTAGQASASVRPNRVASARG